jgi:KDO2-lipid IV(A) lauroyltransferase
LLLAFLIGFARRIPLRVGYRLADLASEADCLLSPRRRIAVEENLRVLRRVDRPGRALVRQVFRNYGRYLFEFLRGPDVPELRVVFQDREILRRALSRGRGVVLAHLHTGNWDVVGARIAREGLRINTVAGIRLIRGWTEELCRRHEECGIRVLRPKGSVTRELGRGLRRNEAVALPLDGNLFRRGIVVPLCGRMIELPPGPARLAGRFQAPLVPVYCFRAGDGTMVTRFLPEVPVDSASQESVRRATALLADRLGCALRDYPEQWMIFRRFFAFEESGAPSSAEEAA